MRNKTRCKNRSGYSSSPPELIPQLTRPRLRRQHRVYEAALDLPHIQRGQRGIGRAALGGDALAQRYPTRRPSLNPRHRSHACRQIQRMAGVSILRQPQVVQCGKHGAHHVVPVSVGAVNAPGCDHHAGLGSQLLKIGVVFRPDRVVLRQHVGRPRGAVGKEVGHAQRAMTPRSCERDAAPDGGVVGGLVSGARVQADEHRGRPFAPAAPQRVAVASAGAQECVALHRFVPPNRPLESHRPNSSPSSRARPCAASIASTKLPLTSRASSVVSAA